MWTKTNKGFRKKEIIAYLSMLETIIFPFRMFTAPVKSVSRPAIMWSKVDFPSPFRPTKPTFSPSSIEKETSVIKVLLPNDFSRIFRSRIIADIITDF